MKRRHSAEYRHTHAISLGGDTPTWEGDVTLLYKISWGCAASFDGPSEGACVTDWRIVAVDREPVGPSGADQALVEHVELSFDKIEPDLIAAAADDDAYHEDEAADRRREELREMRV